MAQIVSLTKMLDRFSFLTLTDLFRERCLNSPIHLLLKSLKNITKSTNFMSNFMSGNISCREMIRLNVNMFVLPFNNS